MKADSLKQSQIMTILSIASMGVDIMIVQNTMVEYAGRDAWISLLLGGILGVAFGLNMYLLANLYPDKCLPYIIIELYGKLIGRILLIPATLYVLLYTGLSINIFGQTLKTFLFDNTPLYAIVAVMIGVVIYAVYKGIYALSGVIDIIFPVALTTLITLILLSLQQVEFDNIKPILYKNHVKVLKGSILGLVQFQGFGLISYFHCFTNGTKIRLKWYFWGTGIPVALYGALTLVTIAVFNPDSLLSLIFPTLTLSKSIEFPITFLERLESIIAILWISIAFGSIALSTFTSVENISALLGSKNDKPIVLIHIPLLMIVSLSIKNGIKVIEYYQMLKYALAGLILIFTPFLVITALIKKRRQKVQ